MTTPEDVARTRQRNNRTLLTLLAPALLCFFVAGIAFRADDSGDGISWPSLLAGAAFGVVLALVLLRLGTRRLAAARRAQQDDATLDALEPLGPAPRGEQR